MPIFFFSEKVDPMINDFNSCHFSFHSRLTSEFLRVGKNDGDVVSSAFDELVV